MGWITIRETLSVRVAVALVGLFAWALAVSPATAAELVVNGSFEAVDASGFPTGWKFGDPRKNKIESEGGRRFLRVALKAPDAAITSQRVALDPSYASVTLKVKLRARNLKVGDEPWKTGRVSPTFYDAAKAQVGGWNAINLAADQDWTEHKLTLDVPPGAVTMNVECGNWGGSGTVDFDEVSVSGKASELPEGQRLTWADKVQQTSRTRSQIDLAGDWLFMEAEGGRAEAPAGPWGVRAVPASVTVPVRRMWYERDVDVPQDWAGRRVELDLQRVSTDAKLWVNDKPAGDYAWPGGTVDVSALLKPGQRNTIRLLVIAVDDRAEVEVLMGYATNAKEKAVLSTRGMIGPVRLLASPRAARLEDVQLRAGVAGRVLNVDLETGGAKPQTLVVTAAPVDGGPPVTLKRVGEPKAGAGGKVYTASFHWPDVKLWDVGQPNLYRVTVSAKNATGLDDELVVPAYGFREFTIDGRQFLLNGTRVHLRPALLGQSGNGSGSDVKTLLARGFNFGEIWPQNLSRRGTAVTDDALIAEADRGGLLISGNALHMADYVNDVAKWERPETRVEYARQMEPFVRRWRNSPSIVMWGTSGNVFQNQADGAPQNLGKRDFLSQQEYANQVKRYDALAGMIKALDPSRPIFAHFGLYTGDVYTSNMYLNFIPLQEREEWLTEWSKNGQMPFMAVEFGVPFWSTWTRGRDGFGQSGTAEVFLSEWAARYLGKEAYALEPAAFRELIAERYVGGEDRRAEYGKVWWWDRKDRIFNESEPFERVQDLYVTNTWRAWRTLGVAGGMIPWDNGMKARALDKVNGPTLAWIAGPEAALLSKDHHYSVGAKVEKQAVLINDAREPQPYEAKWEARVGDKVVATRSASGTIDVGAVVKVPIAFEAAAAAGRGQIVLSTKIGGTTSEDRFAFDVLAAEPKSAGQWFAFDPQGDTTKLLTGLGYTVAPWTTGQPPKGATVVVGRRALSGDGRTGQRDLPADLTDFVREGGRVLVMGQDPDWTRHALHLRVANHVARRAFAVDAAHPVLAGLTDDALRDWNGGGSLVEAYPQYPGYETQLQYGWRNGNRGSISSAAIEKPHRSSLRPIIECEFDLAYSPLMEMEHGAGRVTLCTLDLEARTDADPAATKLARQLFEHVRTAPVKAKATQTVYLGDDAGAATLTTLGVRFERATEPGAPDGLVIVGGGAVDDAALRKWVEAGGRAVVLPRTDAAAVLGVSFRQAESFHGSAAIPAWPEAAGLSASDLHYRANTAAWLVAAGDGVEVSADGLLGRAVIGRGSATFVQTGPDAVPADAKRYFRFTRWRLTRALSQVLSNAGATFEQDAHLLKLLHEPDHAWMLAGEWDATLTAPQPESPRREWRADAGLSERAKRLIASDQLPAGPRVSVPAYMESYGPQWRWVDGEVVFRKQVELPARLAGRDLYWSLGRVDEKETSYLNGAEVGSSQHWVLPRGHRVPGSAVKAGTNTLAVRVFDTGIHGGMCGDPSQLYLRTLPVTDPAFYHEDYVDDGIDESATDAAGWEKAVKRRTVADNPYRYYRW